MSVSASKTKVLVLLGSPRKKGNSAELARHIAMGAEKAGAEVETVYINGLKISPCQACNSCQKTGASGCAVNDDMQQLYPKISSADALVMASPVYWFTVSAQTKIVMDRWYAFGANEYKDLIGKRMAVAMSYGDTDPFTSGCVNALRTFQDACRFIGIKLVGQVYGSADQPGEISANAELMKQAEELGQKLVG